MTSVHSNRAGHAHRVSNPFDSDDDDTPQIVTSKTRGRTHSASSSSRHTNPFEDDGPAHSSSKPTPGRRSVDSSNPFDDDEPAVSVKHVTNGHKAKPSKSGYSSGSGSNPFDAEEVSSKPKSHGDSILDNGSLFEDDERAAKPTKESSPSRGFTSKLKAGGSRFVEGGARIRDSASSTLSSVKMPSIPTFSSSSSTHADEKTEAKRGKAKQQMRDLYGEPQPYDAEQNLSYADQSKYADRTVEQLEQYAISKSQDTTSSIKNCVRIAEDTMGVATTTMETLHDQGAQIRRTHETALRVDEELSRGEKLLGSLGGMFTRTWKPKKAHKITGPEANPEQYKRRGNNSADKDRAGLGLAGNHEQRRRTDLSALSGTQAQLEMEREKQDDALTDLSNVLGQLKNMTLDMGHEIERQNGDLDRMHDDVTELNSRVKGANTRTRRLINR